MKLRFASEADVPALLSIYEQYIPTTITFEYTLPSREEFARRVSSISQFYPYLVLEDDGVLLGYAYAHRIAERAAYGWGAELSIYLRPDAAGAGLGTRLYRVLMELLRLQGVRTAWWPAPTPPARGSTPLWASGSWASRRGRAIKTAAGSTCSGLKRPSPPMTRPPRRRSPFPACLRIRCRRY